MLRVGLTGNVASGKSSVADAWRRAGARIVDADVLARAAVAPGSAGHAAVRRRFGDEILDADGTIDRAALRRIVFADDEARAHLEAIVHPEVGRLREQEETRAQNDGELLVVHEIPLLFETGLERDMDVVVLVHAPEQARLRRLVELRGLSESDARAVMDAQMPAESKRARADIVIDNHGSPEELERVALAVLEQLRTRALAGDA